MPLSIPFEGDVFVAGNEALARSDSPVRLDVGAVKRAVAAARRRVDESAVVIVDRGAAQFLRRWMERVGESRGCRAAKPALAEARCQQVIADAIVEVVDDL